MHSHDEAHAAGRQERLTGDECAPCAAYARARHGGAVGQGVAERTQRGGARGWGGSARTSKWVVAQKAEWVRARRLHAGLGGRGGDERVDDQQHAAGADEALHQLHAVNH